MELIKVIESPEFEYLLYLSNRYKDVKKANLLLIESRDFKIGKVLSNEKYENYSFYYHSQLEIINNKFNSVNINHIDIEELNILKDLIQNLSNNISKLTEEIGVIVEDDIPF